MPPSAASKRPSRDLDAPVYAPASAPNNSLSSRSAGSAPALTRTNGPLFAAELAWMISARISLPAPLGPVMSTGTSARATCVAICTTACMAALRYTMPRRSNCAASSACDRSTRARRSRSADSAACSCSRLRTVVTSRALSQGLAR